MTFYHLNNCFIKRLEQLPNCEKTLLTICQILDGESITKLILKFDNGRRHYIEEKFFDWWEAVPYIQKPSYYYGVTKDYIKLLNHYGSRYLTLFVIVVLHEFLECRSNFVANLCNEYIDIIFELIKKQHDLLINYNNFELQMAWYKIELLFHGYRLDMIDKLSKLKNQTLTRQTIVGAHLDKIFNIRQISNIVLKYIGCLF